MDWSDCGMLGLHANEHFATGNEAPFLLISSSQSLKSFVLYIVPVHQLNNMK